MSGKRSVGCRAVAVAVAFLALAGTSHAANVLVVAPFPALSHYQMLEPLVLGLASRGHRLTVFSHFPRTEKVVNVTDVDLRQISPPFEVDFTPWGLLDDVTDLFVAGGVHCEAFAASDLIQDFLRTEEKFDLIFLETFDSDCYLGFVARFGAPYILFSAMSLPLWESDWIYNPTEVGYLPDNLCRLAGRMNFLERLQNAGCHFLFRALNWYYNAKPSLRVVRDLFRVNLNNLEDIKTNLSFIFVNSFHGIGGVRPLFPNVVEIGGIHLKPPKPLPRNIERFLEDSSEGVLLFSMGSIVRSHTLKPDIARGLLSAISRLEERVLWKWEAEFASQPDNLMTVPWLPQSDVLGHPKVKLFISHGGIHGLYEAIYHGVPIIGIPLFGDQMANLKALEQKGVAAVVDFADLNEKTFSSALDKVLRNDSFRENARQLSRVFRDQPQTPLEKAIFWTEYVIRHGGAPHFQSGAVQLSWLQYALVDVLLVCFSFCILLVVVFHYSLKFLKII